MGDETKKRFWKEPRFIALYLLLPLILGILLSTVIPRPIIGIIRLDDAIYSYTANALIKQIEYARDHAEIRAVLLVLNTPGGTVVDTEAVYLELIKLQAQKPVVTYVQGMAASGGYYLSAATNQIYSGPSSLIGNVGVIVTLPEDPYILEDLVTTGPYKLSGSARDTTLREIEVVKQGFYQAVTLGRGDRLKLSLEGLLSGEIWMGGEALRHGLIDGIGSLSEALDHTADLAKIANYEVGELQQLAGISSDYLIPFFMETADGLISAYPNKAGVYLLYIPQSARRLP